MPKLSIARANTAYHRLSDAQEAVSVTPKSWLSRNNRKQNRGICRATRICTLQWSAIARETKEYPWPTN